MNTHTHIGIGLLVSVALYIGLTMVGTGIAMEVMSWLP